MWGITKETKRIRHDCGGGANGQLTTACGLSVNPPLDYVHGVKIKKCPKCQAESKRKEALNGK